ncbi:MAG: hypothetical protein FJZ96_00610 [Chloroflexi bacterium]|nr:hypothetical protein [Chloroflexota bacterium]
MLKALPPQSHLPAAPDLGRRISLHLARRRGRGLWFALALSMLATGSAALVLGLQGGYAAYRTFGPAAVGGAIFGPGMLMFAAWGLGGMFLWAGARRDPRAAAVFEGGLALRDRDGEYAWPWRDVTAVTASATRREFLGLLLGDSRRYAIHFRDGRQALLGDAWTDAGQLAGSILCRSFPARYAQAAAELEAGKPVSFGPVTLGREGLHLKERSLGWDDIESLVIRRGWLRLAQPGGARVRLDAGRVRNLDVLLALLEQQIPVQVEP